MATLAPKMNTQIEYERPVGAAQSVLGSVASVLAEGAEAIFNDQASRARTGGPTADERKAAALQPYVQELNMIASADKPQTWKDQQVDILSRRALQDFPQYQSDIKAIREEHFGFEPGQGDLDRAYYDGRASWLQTVEGQLAIARNLPAGAGQGSVDPMATEQALDVAYREHLARKGRLELLADRKADGNVTDELIWRDLGPSYLKESTDQAAKLMELTANNPDYVANPEEAMQFLNGQIAAYRNKVLADLAAAGVDPTVAQTYADSAVTPLTSLRDSMNNAAEDTQTVLRAWEAARQLDVFQEWVEIQPLMADPEFRKIIYPLILQDGVTKENILKSIKTLKSMKEVGELDVYKLGQDGTAPTPAQAATVDVTPSRAEKVTEWRRRQEDDPEYIPARLATSIQVLSSADPATPEGQNQLLNAMQNIALAGEAWKGPIGADTMRLIFTPENTRKIRAAMVSEGSNSQEVKTFVTSLLTKQLRANRTALQNTSGFATQYRVRMVNGKLVAEVRAKSVSSAMTGGDGGQGEWKELPWDNEFRRAVDAQNLILSISNGIPELEKVVQNTMGWLNVGVEPTAEQVSDADIDWDNVQIDNISYVAYQAPNALVPLIDRTESGGDYDALFGYSNRTGGRFAGRRVSEMTLGELAQFSDVDGEYGQWVKGEIGRVATPMGRYQFVGTTMRQVANEMGLPPDTVFNQKTQDAMFDYLARKVVRGKSGEEARKSLRATWEGFKNVSDAELDQAIAQFRGTPAPNYANLDRAGGSTVMSTSGGGGSDQSAGLQFGPRGTFDPPRPQSREFGTPARDGSRQIPTGEESPSSRMSTAEARRQVISSLRQFGYSDKEIQEVLKNEDS